MTFLIRSKQKVNENFVLILSMFIIICMYFEYDLVMCRNTVYRFYLWVKLYHCMIGV